MNKQLDEAIGRLRELPEERQQDAAAMILAFLDQEQAEIELAPEQIAEIEAALAEDDVASDEEVETFFSQFRK